MTTQLNRNSGNPNSQVSLPVAELLMRGRELIRYLRRYGEIAWAEWLEDGLEMVRREPRRGVATLLEGFDGIGGISDVYLCPEAGHRLHAKQEAAINEHLLERVSRVYELTRELGDFVDADGLRRRQRI